MVFERSSQKDQGPVAPLDASGKPYTPVLDMALSQALPREEGSIPAPPPALPSIGGGEEAAWRETLKDSGFGEETFRLIVKNGGYEAILADPKKQADLQDVLDSLTSIRIINVRNAMRDLGWLPAPSDQTMHPKLCKGNLHLQFGGVPVVDHTYNQAGYIVQVVRPVERKRLRLVSSQDLFQQPAREFAAQIDSEAAQHRTVEDVAEDLERARERKANHNMVGSSFHFAESMAHSDRISALEKELKALASGREEAHQPQGGADLAATLLKAGFPNASKAIQEFEGVTASNVRALTVALHNAAGLINRVAGNEDLFEASTDARITTERATTKGIDPAEARELHHLAGGDHAKAAQVAKDRMREQLRDLHQQISDWHRELADAPRPAKKRKEA